MNWSKQKDLMCRHCKKKKLINPHAYYCSFMCCQQHGLMPIGNKGCFIDRRGTIKFDSFSLTARSAAWYVKTGNVVKGCFIKTLCTTSGCVNGDHMRLKEDVKRDERDKISRPISFEEKTLLLKMFINGKPVPYDIENKMVPFKQSMQRFSLFYKDPHGTLFSVIVEIPMRCEKK